MSSVLLLEIRIPHNQFREDDCIITAEWRKGQGYVVTQGRVRDGLFSADKAAKLHCSAESAIRDATIFARRAAVANQSREG
jgi:hypothetical protein